MIETLGNHFVELVCPFLLLVPLRLPSIVGGLIQIIFQVSIIYEVYDYGLNDVHLGYIDLLW